MKLRSLFVGAAVLVGVVAATSMIAGCGTQAIGETVADAPDVEGNSGIEDSGDTLNDQYVLGSEAELEGVSVRCPAGWVVSAQTDRRVSVIQDDGDGRIDIELKDAGSAQGDAEELLGTENNDSVGFDETNADAYVIGSTTWYGYEVDGGFALETDGSNDSVVSLTGQGMTLDEAMEMLEGITVNT